jgi:hypothetical protein
MGVGEVDTRPQAEANVVEFDSSKVAAQKIQCSRRLRQPEFWP